MNNSLLWITGICCLILFFLVRRYKKETKQVNTFHENMINIDRYFKRTKNDPISLSPSMFQKDIYDNDIKESKANFLFGIQKSKNDDEILVLLKKRLLEVLKLRELYETTLASSKNEQYRESSVMSFSIEKLKKYDDNTELVNYCALLLDDFDKDREYNYGLREIKIYKTRYIYGSVQSIIEHEIKDIENYKVDFLSKVYSQKDKLESQFCHQYKQKG